MVSLGVIVSPPKSVPTIKATMGKKYPAIDMKTDPAVEITVTRRTMANPVAMTPTQIMIVQMDAGIGSEGQ